MGLTDRDELNLLKSEHVCIVKRIKQLTTARNGVLYNSLFRECLEEAISNKFPYMNKCEAYNKYQVLRKKIVDNLRVSTTHMMVRDEYFKCLSYLEMLGYNVSIRYKEV